jgi:CRISPR/Cas system-associated exonuclease Cas4 (RecB family)
MEARVQKDLDDAKEVIESSVPPVFTAKKICNKCAYMEFCFV